MSLDRISSMPPARLAHESESAPAAPPDEMEVSAHMAADFLKALSHEGRLMILCHLLAGEKTVTELEHLLGQRQAAVSQQLSRLRAEGLVHTRRDGKAIHYAIADVRVGRMIALLYDMFCRPTEG